MIMSLKLRIAGKSDHLRIPIDRLPFLIGRDPLCHLRPTSHFISQHHCAIWSRGDQLLVRDLGSTNGTYLNDHAVAGQQEARHGDRLKIGPLLFDVCLEGPPSVTRPISVPQIKSSTPSAEVEDTAALLLLLEEDASAVTTPPADLDTILSGKTILFSFSPSLQKAPASQSDHGQSKKTVAASSDTSMVAGAILKKYLRRPRP
jgi:predicted component of type VI protein secretion system